MENNSYKINYPQTIVRKSFGTTQSERRLTQLCTNSFLSMWSYPNLYRDQVNSSPNDLGKEICDLLIIFDNHIIIFSDKECAFGESGNISIDWKRWYKKAIKQSAKQILGAERWILKYPNRIFLDKRCSNRLPLLLPNKENVNIHRIIVAHGASDSCRKFMGGGSGSLLLIPSIINEKIFDSDSIEPPPFAVGHLIDGNSFFHVLDDTTLDIALKTLDTISDFVQYLQKKEEFIVSNLLASASGEEDLLAHYLKNADVGGNHTFNTFDPKFSVTITEGLWEDFSKSKQREVQLLANEISYTWDLLIDSFAKHIMDGTSQYMSHPDFNDQE